MNKAHDQALHPIHRLGPSCPTPRAHTERTTRFALSIIYGGGWKNPPKEERLKIKAFGGLFLTIAAASGGVHFYSAFGVWTFTPSLILLFVTGWLFWFEHPITVWGAQDGDHDIGNLHNQPRGNQKTNRDERDHTNGA